MSARIDYQIGWRTDDGAVTMLTRENGYQVEAGAFGLDAPPVDLIREPRTDGDGSILVKRRTTERAVLLPIFVRADGRHVRHLLAHLADVFRGPGTLTVSDGFGTRELRQVYYEAGLEGDEARDRAHLNEWRKVVVSLIAMDPWWYDTEADQTLTPGIGNTAFDEATVDFDDPLTPFDGGTATVYQIPGRAEAFPVWTITGAATTFGVSVIGESSFTIAAALATSATLVVDTRPGATYGPRLGTSGAIDWSLLTAGSRLPRLPNGSTTVVAGVTGDDGNTDLSVAFEPRWLTP